MVDDLFWNIPANLTWWEFSSHGQLANGSASHLGNDTINVMTKGCFSDFSTIACIRTGVMSMLMLLTGALCVAKVCKLHLNNHPTLHQYTIFYCATLECLLCAIHWLLGEYSELDFISQYLKLVQFLLVSHFYLTLATRAVRKEVVTHRVLMASFAIALLYFTVLTIVGCINVKSSWIECFQPYWLALSVAEFALVQLFMTAGIYITQRLNDISTLDSVRRAQKRDLWSLIIAFELSALVSLVYDLTVKTLADEESGCSGVFLHMQEIYSPVFGSFMLMKYLVPLWAMLFVFHPIESAPEHDDLHPAISEDGTYTSVFSPPYDPRHRYKPLYHPGADLTPSDSDISPLSASTPNSGPLGRSTSNLATISEEVAETNDAIDADNANIEESDRRPILAS